MTTEEAVDKSIKHWRINKIKAFFWVLTIDDIRANTCALCTKYRDFGCMDKEDERCPLYAYLGVPCSRTEPWEPVYDTLFDGKWAFRETSKMLKTLKKVRKWLKNQ